MTTETDDGIVDWDDWEAVLSTDRILRAVDAFEPAIRSRDRAKDVGMGRVFVLLIGIALVLATVVTLNQLVADTMRGLEQGM